jgi:hypothetical protein
MRLDAIKRQVAHLRGSGKDSAKARTAAKKHGKGPEESGMDAQLYLCVRFSIGNLPTVHVVCKQTMVLDKAQSRTSPHSR